MSQRYLSGVIAGVLSFAQLSSAQYLWWHNQDCGDIMEIMVRVSDTATTTFYETLGWNQGENGGGYTGIQTDKNMHPLYIFSLWNPDDSNLTVLPVYVNPNGTATAFSGQGTGLRYLNSKTPWALNTWYRQVVRAWQYGGLTYYGMWTCNLSNTHWIHHLTFSFPDPNMAFCPSATSYLDNWSGANKSSLRRVNFTGGWKRVNGEFIKLDTATIDGKVSSFGTQKVSSYPTVFIQTGLPTENQETTFTIDFDIPPFIVDPVNPYVTRQSIEIQDNLFIYSWTVDSHQSPPFSHTVQLIDNRNNQVLRTQSNIKPQERAVAFNLNHISVPTEYLGIKAVLTDIYDVPHATQLNIEEPLP